MSWEQVLLALGSIGTAVYALVRLVLPKMVQAKISSDEFVRSQEAAREDRMFEMFDWIIKDIQEERKQDRLERQKDREQLAVLVENIHNLAGQIERTTAELARKIQHNADVVTLLSQHTAQVEDRLALIERKLDP